MTLHVWLSFVAATIVVCIIPGPTVLQSIGDALSNGKRQSWSTVLGVGTGDTIAMSLSLLGAGTLLSASAAAFTILKTLGGLYLMYLGIRAALEARRAGNGPVVSAHARSSAMVRFSKTATVTMLNPKAILFFVAFVPQFISPAQGFFHQAAILLPTFVLLAMANCWVYMSLAGAISTSLQTPLARKRLGYASGGVLFLAGSLTLALKRR